MFKFRAVLTHCQPFLSGSVSKRATNPDSNAEKWPIIMQFAVCSSEEDWRVSACMWHVCILCTACVCCL
jgi:hypothetical protein